MLPAIRSGKKPWEATTTIMAMQCSKLAMAATLLVDYSAGGVNGDKTEASRGSHDYWVVKLDAAGNKMWDKTYGGNGWDELHAMQQTSDGGYMLGGHSFSNASGDKTENRIGVNYADYWVVKLDADGNKEWDKTIGGTSGEDLHAIQQTSDGGYLLGGSSFSGIGYDKSEANLGGDDFWVVKLDAAGNKEWDRTLGGNGSEKAYTLLQATDGRYLVGGYSQSGINGNKTAENKGNSDFWLVKLDEAGAILWDKTLGGSSSDVAYSLQQTADGGYVLGGTSSSGISGDKTGGSISGNDFWVVKLDANANKAWDKTIDAGTEYDQLRSLRQTSDGGYILGGFNYKQWYEFGGVEAVKLAITG